MALSYEELLKRFGISPESIQAPQQPKAPLLATPSPKIIQKQPSLSAPTEELPMPEQQDDPFVERLEGAEKARNEQKFMADLIDASSRAGAAIARVPFQDNKFSESMKEQADQMVKDVQQARSNIDASQKQKLNSLQVKQAEEMQDPKSEVSKQYRSFAKNLGISVPDTSTAASMEKLAPLYERYMAMREAFSDKAERRQDAKMAQQEEKAKLSDKQLQVLKDFQESQQVLGDLSADLKPGYVGPLDQMRPELLMSPEQSAYTKLLGRYKDSYRKAITGAGASSKEIEMLESRLPAIGQTEANYQGALKQMIKEAQAKQAGYIDLLKRQGKDVSQFEDLVKPQSDMVKVQLPDGRTGSIPKSKLEEAVKRGAKVL